MAHPKLLFGGYSPLRRAYRRFRPGWMARLSPAGRQIRRFVDEYGLVVRHGPFAGMVYPDRADGHAGFLAAKLLGSYELELHPALAEAISGSQRQIVDVGAADGYYAVGLAIRAGEGTRIEAFEVDASERRTCRAMAQLNGVADRVVVHGHCDTRELGRTLDRGAFVLCDCEGYELELLRPDRVPALESATIVAELHPAAHPNINQIVTDRFVATHHVHLLRMQPRDPSQWSELDGWAPNASFLVLSECAPTPDQVAAFERCWAYIIPRVIQPESRPS